MHGIHEMEESDSPATHAKRLASLRADAVDRVTSTSAALRALVQDRSSLNDDDEHDPDGAPLSAEWSRLAGQVDAAQSELRQIEAALLRLEEGRYGVCSTCGQRIPNIRLRVRPFAEHCVSCAEQRRGRGRQ
ncbi:MULTISPECIES: TraR/DksA C4-type zinc finger protein [unclassified Pseudoclavibacter]|uniref:TraR/DksA family transcriptional regulator n=1 Tax=unclassified Pseudoclavibacter TaxID=2615177 RepID=UPI001809BE7B|nr:MULTISPECIES: TraR/DksA C4-type zinc finger protein [unclassified Pseudoclavibacter]NYF13255.1 RNA polymerase-binding transcription factor DksA [Pseudoclavibacter sp. JAI123]